MSKINDFIIFARKGAAKPINNCGTKTILQVKNVKDKIHPTEKPTELLRIFIENSTNEGDIILDPFGGSMSTALAALQTNRKCISFEIDENYYNRGLERLNNFDIKTDIITTEKKKKELTNNQKIILEILKNNPEKDFSGEELHQLTGLSTRTCSGCITPLCTQGLAEKTNKKSPFKIKLKSTD